MTLFTVPVIYFLVIYTYLAQARELGEYSWAMVTRYSLSELSTGKGDIEAYTTKSNTTNYSTVEIGKLVRERSIFLRISQFE